MYVRRTGTLVCSVAIAVLTFTAGCSSNEDTSACNTIVEKLNEVGTEASEADPADPSAVGQIYIDAAGEIRAAGGGASDDVATAATELATELEGLGNSLVNLDASNPQVPDTTGFTEAGDQMRAACT